LNTVKPRSAITRFSPSMVCGTDLLLGLVMTPSEDCVLSGIRLPFEVRRSCARLREIVVSGSLCGCGPAVEAGGGGAAATTVPSLTRT